MLHVTDLYEDDIAHEMPEFIVHVLEMINIQNKHRKVCPVTHTPGNFILKDLVQL